MLPICCWRVRWGVSARWPCGWRWAPVVMQIAVCLTLLIAAGLLTRNLQKLQTIETGLVTKNVFTLTLSAQGTEPSRVNEFYRQMATRLRALPGVKSVS